MRPHQPLFALAALAFPGLAHAVVWYGADLGGADLIPADGDVVSGTFTNVGTFHVPAGVTITVDPGIVFEVHALTVVVDGTIDADGAGLVGGNGGPMGIAQEGFPGTGPGAGDPGKQGPCVHGGGGGGGGYGGAGGDGGYHFADGNTHYPNGGSGYGVPSGTTGDLGSGGGGGGSGCSDPGGVGGTGGGAVLLFADTTVTVEGTITANGMPGQMGTQWAGHGGGGSGGAIVLSAPNILGTGALNARGGAGGGPEIDASYESDGGGGAGGRIKVASCIGGAVFAADAAGGPAGGTCIAGAVYCPSRGDDGEVDNGTDDSDGDGVPNGCDPCPFDFPDDTDGDGACDSDDNCAGLFNDQADGDGDGVGDACDICAAGPDGQDTDQDGVPNACDPCPRDATDDSDFDGVCDGDDRCDGYDDTLDFDEDRVPDGCDNCPNDANSNQADIDDDGAGNSCDCEPENPNISPVAAEICDGVDNNCDDEVDNDAIDAFTYYEDADGDQDGNPDETILSCDPVAGYVSLDGDCDDADATVHSQAIEVCDTLDNDCDGSIDEEIPDCALTDDGTSPKDSGGCGCDGGAGSAGLTGVMLLGLLVGLRRRT